MPLPVITDTVRASVEGTTGNGAQWANVLHFRKTGVLTYTGAIAILDPLLFALYNTNQGAGSAWKNTAATTVKLQQIRYTPLDGTSASSIYPHLLPGTSGSEELPGNVALVISLHTARRGRSYRGRMYWAGFAENFNGPNGLPDSTALGSKQSQVTNWLATLSGSGVSLVVASYLHQSAEDVVSLSINGRWDSQRRRLGR